LKPREERTRSAHQLMDAAREFLAGLPGRHARVFDMSMSAGGDSDFEFHIKGNVSLLELDALSDRFIAGLEEREGYFDLEKSLKLGLPEVRVIPDREKAAALGVDATSLATVIQVMIGGRDVGTFKEGGHSIDIRMRLDREDRSDPESIERLYVRNVEGRLVELRNLVQVKTDAAPSSITRTNRQRSVRVSGNLAGKNLGAAVAEAEQIASEILPEGVSIELGGNAEVFRDSFLQFTGLLALSLLAIYMILAAQFESLVHPITVMLAILLAAVGALGALYVTGMTRNLFSMIGIILLMGLVTKNSILLVDYTNQLRREGMGKVEAVRHAAPVRMRPVLMTAISMIFGVLPAALGVGPGSETRQPMGVATAAGMFTSTCLTLLLVPVFYLVLDDLVEAAKAAPARLLRRFQPARDRA
ncbi:MAG: efflux RND transporter permease subunit, partial [Myxococcota bacterium]